MGCGGATKEEIASRLGISSDTLLRRFKEDPTLQPLYDQGLGELKLSLRHKQVEMALGGNVTMLIWLGKQLLGQKDKQELTEDENAPMVPAIINVHLVKAGTLEEIEAKGEARRLAIQQKWASNANKEWTPVPPRATATPTSRSRSWQTGPTSWSPGKSKVLTILFS